MKAKFLSAASAARLVLAAGVFVLTFLGPSGAPAPGAGELSSLPFGGGLAAPAQRVHAAGNVNQFLPIIAAGNYDVFLPVLWRNNPFPSLFGVQASTISPSAGLDRLVTSGTRWVRAAGIPWMQVEPNKGDRNWSAVADQEQQILRAANNRLTPIIIVSSTPAWAQRDGKECGPIKAEELATFGAFVRDLVARYSAPPYNVKYWEFWNEPDIDVQAMVSTSPIGCWGDDADAHYGGGYYAEMLKHVYPQVKAADPKAQVLVGGLLLDCDPNNPPAGKDCKPSKFLEGILLNGGAPFFDGVSFHAYDYYVGVLGNYINAGWNSAWNTTGPVTIAKSQFLKSVLAAHNVTGKYLINTEAALLCPLNVPQIPCDATQETTKAYYVPQVYAAALAEGLVGNVWYAWDDNSAFQALVDSNYNPKPAFNAYQFAASLIRNAQFARLVTDFPNVKVYELTRDNLRIWVMWSLNGEAQPITLSSAPMAAYEYDGTALTPATGLTITVKPIYLVWSP